MLPAILLREDDLQTNRESDIGAEGQAAYTFLDIKDAEQEAEEFNREQSTPYGAPPGGRWTWKYTRATGCKSVVLWSTVQAVYLKDGKAWDKKGRRVKVVKRHVGSLNEALLMLGAIFCPCVVLPIGLIRGCQNWRPSVD